MKNPILKVVAVSAAAALVVSIPALAAETLSERKKTKSAKIEAVPFAFSNESMGFAAGAAGLWVGAGQPQAALFGAGLVSSKETWLGFLSANNYVLAPNSRWLLGGQIYAADYKQFDYYFGQAAANDSLPTEKIKANSKDQKHHLSFRYILPIGAAETQPLRAALIPDREITGNNPLSSGVSSIDFRPFYQSRYLSDAKKALPPSDFSSANEIWALETRLRWDNRNQTNNPTQGSSTEFSVTADLGDLDQPSWWKWELNQSLYLDLGGIDGWINQQVLATNFYLSDTPTWEKTDVINGQIRYRRPPEFAAPTLGGLYRLRSYGSGRFTDRTALAYSFEYRMNPAWQPLGDLPVFNWYNVPWWQWVGFLDVGRVADRFHVSDLHTDMKWSAGIGIRFQVEGIVVRTETAFGDEEGAFRFMINQPF